MNPGSSLESVLCDHLRRYPEMRPQDLFKLVYQNVFGGGHLIVCEEDSLACLLEETGRLSESARAPRPLDVPLFEDIGGGLCRMNLAPAAYTGIEWTTFNRFFVISASSVTGSRRLFRKKLLQARRVLRPAGSCFSKSDQRELDGLIRNYPYREHPPVSHSEPYRKAYAPSYRIVKSVFRDTFEVFRRIDGLLKTRPSVTVAIDGLCGAGKSTLADLLQQVYGCDIIRMDHFFLPPVLRTPGRLAEAGGNVDYERFSAEILPGLREGRPFAYRVFDCSKMAMGESVTVTPGRLAVVEGSYSLHPKIGWPYDLKIFLMISPEEQSRRILSRNGPRMRRRFLNEWIPMENRYFDQLKIPESSDLVLWG